MLEPIDLLYSTPQMAKVFSAQAHVQGMLTFEAALARAEARLDIIPPEVVAPIETVCKAELFDVTALYHEAVIAGTPAIPLIRMLTEHVEGEAKKFVHWGATSQDVIDTATMLQVRDGLNLLIASLHEVCEACAFLARQHRHTLMVGRTLLQQALPITFGLKAARWLVLAMRQRDALRALLEHTLAVQLGGAAGTLASLAHHGPQVMLFLAEELALPAPDLPWHAERDRIASLAAALGVAAGAMGKIANDIVLLAQTEVDEMTECASQGKGGSSALPQKHNPVDAMLAIASARLAVGEVPVLLSAMVQEHERAVGGWQAEWTALPHLFCYTAGAVEHVRQAVSGLRINVAHMRANLDITHGLILSESLTMALAPYTGRPEARRIVQDACEEAAKLNLPLRQVALSNTSVRSHLSPEQVDHALDPMRYLGSTELFIDRVLANFSKEESRR